LNRLKRLPAVLKEKGIKYALRKVLIQQPYTTPVVPNYTLVRRLFKGQAGIEIGGPSGLFGKKNNYLPLYTIVKSLDNCNFSASTIWEGSINSGQTFNYHENKTGIQFIAEATLVSDIPKKNYRFLLSSNCLEHVANPLKALNEWLSVVDSGGILLLILPNKDYCFDRKRPVTRFSHLLEDFKNDVQEDDLTHLDEILSLHDLSMDLQAGNFEQFKARSLKNFENRALHHHVFDMPLLKEIMEYLKLDVLMTNEAYMHIIITRKRIFKSALLARLHSSWRKFYCYWYRTVGLY